MLKGLKLYNFKYHLEWDYFFDFLNIIYWPNWSWKTNILEAIYFILNWSSYKSLKPKDLLNYYGDNFYVSTSISSDSFDNEYKITYDKQRNLISFFYNNSKVTRPKYISSTNHLAIFFSPIEMNIMFLWPSLRRDFLDEVSTLDDKKFIKIKWEYQKILKNRNKLLKEIGEWNAIKNDISFWDNNFIKASEEYYKYRLWFIDYIKNNISLINTLLENKYEIIFEYESKVDFTDISWSIKNYLDVNFSRDIIVGHTYIWPHLDDFIFKVKWWDEYHDASAFLSRWENKSILLWLKILEIEYFKEKHSNEIVLLLDDIFSELDDHHINLVLSYASKYQTFISAQNIPWFLLDNSEFKLIKTN